MWALLVFVALIATLGPPRIGHAQEEIPAEEALPPDIYWDVPLPVLSAPVGPAHWIRQTIAERRERYTAYIYERHADVAPVLICIADHETAGYWYPAIRNFAGSGASGLTQFLPSTYRRVPESVRQGRPVDDGYGNLDAAAWLLHVSPYEYATYPGCRR